jgi:hypothetical protein
MADIPSPFPVSGTSAGSSFATLEALMAYYARAIPLAFVHGLIEAEKEVFVVRRECSLRETQIQFLRKCESALARALAEAQAGRAAWDWNWAPSAEGDSA